MAKQTCGCDENAEQSVSSKVIRHILCVKSNQKLVIRIAEILLPILFWLSIIASVVLAFKAASVVAAVTSNAFCIILSFVAFLVAFLLVTVIGFYVIYLLKALKDSVTCKCKENESCECKDDKLADTFNPSASLLEEPVKIRRKPGPKKGSKRGRRPRPVITTAE
ncbi:MAG: hypothetical protein LBJ88_06470 [Campylobacteraceae bacterium]|jgi:hypothetical protein|nr:hypothetical protein [Campylobacteraceae bacterium]